jgi:hypothetical protein
MGIFGAHLVTGVAQVIDSAGKDLLLSGPRLNQVTGSTTVTKIVRVTLGESLSGGIQGEDEENCNQQDAPIHSNLQGAILDGRKK